MVCKKCGKEISENMLFCPFCGEKIIKEPALIGKKVCSQCKKIIPEEARFCPFCGNDMPVSEKSIPVQTEETSTLGILSIIFGVLGGLLGLIFGIIGLAQYEKEENRHLCKIGIGFFVGEIILGILILIITSCTVVLL